CPGGLSKDPVAPLCDQPKPMSYANEVLGDPAALYRTRSGRGETGILALRERLVDWGVYDEGFSHFRQCMNGDRRPASMTWYVSPISQVFMDSLLPSAKKPDAGVLALGPKEQDPCQNNTEMALLLDRFKKMRASNR